MKKNIVLCSASITELEGLISSADLPRSVELLEEIRSRLDRHDPDLLVALAVRLFVLGEDNKAAEYLRVSLVEKPDNTNALKLQLFCAAAVGSGDAVSLCQELLKLHPSDDWVVGICRKLAEADTSSLSLPPLQSYWENLATTPAGRR